MYHLWIKFKGRRVQKIIPDVPIPDDCSLITEEMPKPIAAVALSPPVSTGVTWQKSHGPCYFSFRHRGRLDLAAKQSWASILWALRTSVSDFSCSNTTPTHQTALAGIASQHVS